MSDSPEQRTRLENGLLIVTERMPAVRSVSIGVWVGRGSRDEPEALNGITHFLEHMLFKGTESRSNRDIAIAIDAMGGQLDAFTSREDTCYYAMVLDEHQADAVELLADLFLRPRFDPDELERERGVVLEEIAAAEDDPEDLLHETFAATFWENHPLGRPILGSAATVESFTRELLSERVDAIGGREVVVAAAGNLDHDEFVELVASGFSALGPGHSWAERTAPIPSPHCLMIERSDLEQVQLYLAAPAPEATSAARYTAEVMNTLLGGSVSSRLFQAIREERGLAYNVYSSLSNYSDAGYLCVSAGTRAEAVADVFELIAAELLSLRSQPVASEELARIKEHLKGALMLGLENTFGRMVNLARQTMAFGRAFSLDEILAGIEGVTADDVHRLARATLDPSALATGLIARRKVVSRLVAEWGDGLLLPGELRLAPDVRSRRN